MKTLAGSLAVAVGLLAMTHAGLADSQDGSRRWTRVVKNAYRGCEHGCIYCFARPNHEYLGFSAGLDFETKILVKEDAPELLRRELSLKSWKP